MRVVLALVFMVLGSGVAFAGMQGCYDGKVRTANGADVSTAAGQEFKIYPGQGPHTATWMPLDRLSICRDKANAYRLTDLNQKNEQVLGLYLGAVPPS